MRRIHHIFNEKSFSPKRYARLKAKLTGAYGLHGVKVCETPVFLGRDFINKLTTAAQEMAAQCMNPDTLKELDKAVPDKFRVPNVPEKPPFLIVDFAITRDEQTGGLKPQLIELQACSSVMAYLADAALLYKDIYRLDKDYTPFPAHKGEKDFKRALQKAVLGTHDPKNVVLLEIEPEKQKTKFDFLATQKYLGVKTVENTVTNCFTVMTIINRLRSNVFIIVLHRTSSRPRGWTTKPRSSSPMRWMWNGRATLCGTSVSANMRCPISIMKCVRKRTF